MIFQSNYSDALVERTEGGRYADEFTLDSSDVDIKLDMSSAYLFLFEHYKPQRDLNLDYIESDKTKLLFLSTQTSKSAHYYTVTFNSHTLTLSMTF